MHLGFHSLSGHFGTCKTKTIQTEIASLLDVNRSSVSRVTSRYRQCCSIENRPRTGRPPILSPRAKRVLFKDVKKCRNAPYYAAQ